MYVYHLLHEIYNTFRWNFGALSTKGLAPNELQWGLWDLSYMIVKLFFVNLALRKFLFYDSWVKRSRNKGISFSYEKKKKTFYIHTINYIDITICWEWFFFFFFCLYISEPLFKIYGFKGNRVAPLCVTFFVSSFYIRTAHYLEGTVDLVLFSDSDNAASQSGTGIARCLGKLVTSFSQIIGVCVNLEHDRNCDSTLAEKIV